MHRGGWWRAALWSLCGVALLATACGRGAASPARVAVADPASRVRSTARAYVAAYDQTFPDLAEYMGRPLEHHDSLPDNSLGALRIWQEREDAWLAELATIDAERLFGTPEWATYGYLRTTLESSVAARVCRVELWPAHQFGWQTTLLAILDTQPLGSPALRAQALARWGQLGRYLETERDNLREGIRLGYTAPRRNIELAVAQLDALLAQSLDASPLSGPSRRDADTGFRAHWSELVNHEMLPAITRYRDFLRDEYAPRARASLGITGIPNGAACYRAQIKTHTTKALAPAEVYELGQELVAEREAKALALARASFGDQITDLRAAKAALDADPRNRFASAEEALRFVEQALSRADRAAPLWFSRVPRSPLTLLPYDDFEAKAHPNARYEPAAKDGAHPARFRIDTTNFALLQRVEIETTAFHEGIPGHHLQLGLELELPNQMERGDLRALTSFFEGWARYAESLADEMGLYGSDLDRFGAVAHLPTGLVVDPGVHAMGWTREDAIAWAMAKQVGFSAEAAASYVDRIAVCPGEMLSYGFGEREFVALRREAEAALGERFDLKAFHEQVLAHGAIPLPALREVVTRWVEKTRRARERRPLGPG